MTEIEFVDKSEVKLVQSNATDLRVCHAAWVSNFGGDHENEPSYWAGTKAHEDWDKKTTGLINFLYRERHMSPFEHGSMTFFVETPIFVAREFMRHRTFSYNEMSGRYKKLNPKFYLVSSDRPLNQKGKIGSYRFDGGTDEQYGTVFAHTQMANQMAWDSYELMLEKDVAKEVARNVLPVNIMTQFYVTGNPRNWMQFFLLRSDPNALHEIREVAEKIEIEFAKAMPKTFSAFREFDYREEKKELIDLRKKVAQYEAAETYPEFTAHA